MLDTVTPPAPVNGSAVQHPFVPPTLPPRVSPPLSPWPRQDDTDAADQSNDKGKRWHLSEVRRWQPPDGDTVIAWAMAVAAGAVILFAAIVSYSHIHGLAVAHGEDNTQSHLLPLSIDGVIAEASLVMLYAARHKGVPTPRLARVMLWSGIVATLAANAVVALPAQWIDPVANAIIGAILSAWPAAAFIGSVELVMLLVRSVRAAATRDDTDDDPDRGEEDRQDREDDDTDKDKKPPPPPRAPRGTDPVIAAIRRHPGWADDKIAALCHVSVRTVQRRREVARKAGTPKASQEP